MSNGRFLRRSPFRLALFALFAALVVGASGCGPLPANFQQTVAFSGLDRPTAVRFAPAPDTRVFISEKGGVIKEYNSLADTTPTQVADLSTQVHDFWDRGLLGFAIDPNFPSSPYLYVLYSRDASPLGGPVPRWGDGCPKPPAATGDGCVISGRLSRLQIDPATNKMVGSEQVLLDGWCQQYPSHSVGSLAFGNDGSLYVSGGDGASFNYVDYGESGGSSGSPVPRNPCGDPPGAVGATLSPPTARGGSLRSQSLQRPWGDDILLNGAVLRVNKDTGAAVPSNALAAFGHPNPNARRIIADGLRNPFRMTVRPGTNEVWVGDVGWNDWEEINRVDNPTGAVPDFGWPCYEGTGRQPGYEAAGLDMCDHLYASGGAAPPYYTYNHAAKIAGESCPTGGSSISGLAFYPGSGGPYPASYNGGLFFGDFSRGCIWIMKRGSDGLPDPTQIKPFVDGGADPVDLQVSPNGDLFYANYNTGNIMRVQYYPNNQPPHASATATPTNGAAPLSVQFDGRGSSDPDIGPITYAWDLDGDGQFNDSTSPTPSRTYPPGNTTVRLKVTDQLGASDVSAPITISSDNTPPQATIDAPAPTTAWSANQQLSFAGSATDAQDGPLAAAALSWSVILHHCPSTCHLHQIQDFDGVSSGSFTAPDHQYPSWIELRLTATDAGGLQDVTSLRLDPSTIQLTLDATPPGLELALNSESNPAPFTRTVITGSANSIAAASPQTLGDSTFDFTSWSDAGDASHVITAGSSDETVTATYDAESPGG